MAAVVALPTGALTAAALTSQPPHDGFVPLRRKEASPQVQKGVVGTVAYYCPGDKYGTLEERRCQCMNDFARETIREHPMVEYISVLVGGVTVSWHKKNNVWYCTETGKESQAIGVRLQF